jgi:hypothetical protein
MSINNNKKISKIEKLDLEKDIEYDNLSTKEKETKLSYIEKKDPIYIMTLELEKGKPEELKIYSDSDPIQLASYFCKKHNLDYNGLDYLKEKIQTLLNQNNINLISSEKEEITNNSNNINDNLNYQNKINNDLKSPKQNRKKINILDNKKERRNKSSSKKQSHKCKARIENNENSDKIFNKLYKEIKYKDIKNENRYNNQLNNKIREISNINNNIYNSEKINKNNNKINNYREYLNERNRQLKLGREKELSDLQKQINNNKNIINDINNNSIKNYKKKNYFFNTNQNSKYKKEKIDKKINNRISNILKEYEQKYSFHPSINGNYKTDLTFEQRQAFFKNLYKKRKEELKNLYLNSKKDENGYFYFKPKLISKSYYNEDYKNKNDIFNKNYIYFRKYDLDKEELFKKYYNIKNEPIIYTKKKNEKIINETKIKTFINLFKDLDSDQDNFINGININITKIPKNVYNIIEPLLNELKEDNHSLNKEEFLIAMDRLFDDISSIDRRIIINAYSNGKQYKKNKGLNINNSFLNENNKYRSLTPNCTYNNKVRTTPCTNNNTNKLAFKHYKKIKQMFDDLNVKNYDNYYCDYNNNSDVKINKIGNKIHNKKSYFGIETNINDENFTYICNCTFNNYIKKLN